MDVLSAYAQISIKLNCEIEAKQKLCWYLGIHREMTDKSNIEKKLSLGRKAAYSIIGAGFHTGNGLKVCYLWSTFVVPRITYGLWPGAVVRSEACSLGMQAAPSSIPTSGTFFRGDLVMKSFLRPFSLLRWFKKSSCQLLAKECALSTGKPPRRLAQEQCG